MHAELPLHEFSLGSPDMSDSDMISLRESIEELGQLVPIVTWRGQIIDGRKRWTVCQKLKREPKVVAIPDDGDPGQHAQALNLFRTQYTQSQRAMFAAMIANATKADGTALREAKHHQVAITTRSVVTATEAGKLTGSDKATVLAAQRIRRTAAPEVTDAVKAGHLSLYAAKQIADHPMADQPALVEQIKKAKGNRKKIPPGTLKPRIVTTRHKGNKPLIRAVQHLQETAEVVRSIVADAGHLPPETATALRSIVKMLMLMLIEKIGQKEG